MYGHEGQFKTKERILQSYWWPGMDEHINQHLRTCERCQLTKKLVKHVRISICIRVWNSSLCIFLVDCKVLDIKAEMQHVERWSHWTTLEDSESW